ncbi:MAG: hypothetical protein ABI051_13540 [Vicinamibacterales bacterium]
MPAGPNVVILRPTRKLRSFLPATDVVPATSDTALGDWYVNRIVIDKRPLLLLVSSTSLLPILVPARDVRRLRSRLAELVSARLKRCGIDDETIAAEAEAMSQVAVGPTVDRSVVGIMVDFAKALPSYLEPGRWDDATLEAVEARLAETPCRAARSFGQVIFPDRKAPELLRATWPRHGGPQLPSGGWTAVH